MKKIDVASILGSDADSLLNHECIVNASLLRSLPSKDNVDKQFMYSDRNNRTLRSLSTLFNHGRLQGTGYTSILPVDQGIEHSAGASFSENPEYFDPENIIQLAIEGGCNAIASTLGTLSLFSRKYAHKIPFIVKLNHNELLSYPTKYNQTPFASVEQAYNMGAIGVGATIYFGSKESKHQITEVSAMFEKAHSYGMFTILWCYLRNDEFSKEKDYHESADLTAQAIHIGATIGADIVKQKLATCNGGYKEFHYGKTHEKVYTELSTNHPIDLARYQLLNSYSGRIGLIHSGGPSHINSDLHDAVRVAVINKRCGGTGVIVGRKAFMKSKKEGIALLNAVQDVYLDEGITIA